MLEKGKLADVLFLCTLDKMHYLQAIKAMELGYDLLLEKPISVNKQECEEIARIANELDRKVVVCHVLRYTLFYKKIKELIEAGQIGDVVSIQAMEHVAYWHQAHSFVRGNWNNSNTTSPMILQKCCHDMDIYLWLAGKKCSQVSSFGSLYYFKEENAPKGAPSQCSEKCPEFENCIYNPWKFYYKEFEQGYQWPIDVLIPKHDKNLLDQALKTGPYGRCIYKCDNNVVDHQVVILNLEDGSTIDFQMTAFTADFNRTMTIMGTKGHIEASLENKQINVFPFGKDKQIYNVSNSEDDAFSHSGGDLRLLQSFAKFMKTGQADSSITTIDVSVASHLVALAAEQSRLAGGKVVKL